MPTSYVESPAAFQEPGLPEDDKLSRQSLQSTWMGPRMYGTTSVTGALGVTVAQIKWWLEKGILSPNGRAANGKGTRHYFTVKNLVEVRIIASLTGRGMAPEDVAGVLKELSRARYFERLGLSSRERGRDPVAVHVLGPGRVYIVNEREAQAGLPLTAEDSESIVTLNLLAIERCVAKAVREMEIDAV